MQGKGDEREKKDKQYQRKYYFKETTYNFWTKSIKEENIVYLFELTMWDQEGKKYVRYFKYSEYKFIKYIW